MVARKTKAVPLGLPQKFFVAMRLGKDLGTFAYLDILTQR